MNANLITVIAMLEHGIYQLKHENLTLKQQADIFRAIASISNARHEQYIKQQQEVA